MEVFRGVIAGICSKSVRVIWRILVILESGDSYVITRWTVHQEVRIKPMAEIKFCVTRDLSPGLLHSFDKMGTGFWWLGSFTYSLDLKYGSLSFADWLWAMIAPVLGLKTIPDLLDTNSTHRASHMSTPPHHTPVTTWAMYAT